MKYETFNDNVLPPVCGLKHFFATHARLLKNSVGVRLLGSGGACLADEAIDCFGGIGADGKPFIGLLEINLVVGALKHRIVSTDLLDIASVAALAAVDGYDFIVRTVFGALAVESERN